MPYKRLRRVVRKTGKFIRKRVWKPYTQLKKQRGRKNRMKLYSEVTALKKMVNAEKKTAVSQGNGIALGQFASGAEGAYCTGILPVIAQGNGFDQRDGRSIRLSGLYFRGKLTQQTNTVNRLSIRMTFFMAKGIQPTGASALTGMYLADPLSTVRDIYASRNPDTFTDYRVIAVRNYTLVPDSVTGATGNVDVQIPLKLGHHVRYDQNTSTIQEGQIFLLIQCNSGDSAAANTGAWFQFSASWTYYDN